MSRKGKILVVDDQEEMRQFFLRILSSQGFQVTAAGSGPEALSVLKIHSPDLIFLDLRMPGMDGLETLRQIREHDAKARVVIFTAWGTLETARRAMELGARDYLGEPMGFDLLLRVVKDNLAEAAPIRRGSDRPGQ